MRISTCVFLLVYFYLCISTYDPPPSPPAPQRQPLQMTNRARGDDACEHPHHVAVGAALALLPSLACNISITTAKIVNITQVAEVGRGRSGKGRAGGDTLTQTDSRKDDEFERTRDRRATHGRDGGQSGSGAIALSVWSAMTSRPGMPCRPGHDPLAAAAAAAQPLTGLRDRRQGVDVDVGLAPAGLAPRRDRADAVQAHVRERHWRPEIVPACHARRGQPSRHYWQEHQ
jgi:hypothetical protein